MQSIRTPRRFLLAATACLALGAASTASANGGVILFAGEVTGATCQVVGVDTGGLSSFTVQMPNVSATQLEALDSTAGHTRFGLELSNCSGVANGVQAYFQGGPGLDVNTNSLLPNNGGPIHFALFNDDGGRIRLGDYSQTAGPSYAADSRMFFDVAYLRAQPGPITPGTFEGVVTYSLHYL